jgi:hypothetical protein
MQDLIALRVVLTGSAQSLPSRTVTNGLTVVNNSADTVAIDSSSEVSLTMSALIPPSSQLWISLPGGNANQIWLAGTDGQIVSVVGA